MVNQELGRAANTPFSLNDSAVRTLAGKPSGAISFADLLGKAAGITLTAGQFMSMVGYDVGWGFGSVNSQYFPPPKNSIALNSCYTEDGMLYVNMEGTWSQLKITRVSDGANYSVSRASGGPDYSFGYLGFSFANGQQYVLSLT